MLAGTLNAALTEFSRKGPLLLGVLAFKAPVELNRRSLTTSLLFKYVFFFFSLQPFFAVAHGPYYVQFIPLLALAFAVTAAQWRFAVPREWPTSPDEWLVLAGSLFAFLFGVVVVVVATFLD
ncbi:MAG: hypothetical protein ABGW98_18745 [Myxococcales bacterium]